MVDTLKEFSHYSRWKSNTSKFPIFIGEVDEVTSAPEDKYEESQI